VVRGGFGDGVEAKRSSRRFTLPKIGGTELNDLTTVSDPDHPLLVTAGDNQ
jgi:hypothetical protein